MIVSCYKSALLIGSQLCTAHICNAASAQGAVALRQFLTDLQVRLWDVRTYNCLQVFDEHVTQKPKPKPARAESAGSRCAEAFFVVGGNDIYYTSVMMHNHVNRTSTVFVGSTSKALPCRSLQETHDTMLLCLICPNRQQEHAVARDSLSCQQCAACPMAQLIQLHAYMLREKLQQAIASQGRA